MTRFPDGLKKSGALEGAAPPARSQLRLELVHSVTCMIERDDLTAFTQIIAYGGHTLDDPFVG